VRLMTRRGHTNVLLSINTMYSEELVLHCIKMGGQVKGMSILVDFVMRFRIS
jgi:hypothetical protein